MIRPVQLKKARRYFLQNGNDVDIAWFDSLLTAALVARYITGAELTESERDEARYALIVFDRERKKE